MKKTTDGLKRNVLPSSSLQCFPKGVDMMAALDLYFQVNKTALNSGSREQGRLYFLL